MKTLYKIVAGEDFNVENLLKKLKGLGLKMSGSPDSAGGSRGTLRVKSRREVLERAIEVIKFLEKMGFREGQDPFTGLKAYIKGDPQRTEGGVICSLIIDDERSNAFIIEVHRVTNEE